MEHCISGSFLNSFQALYNPNFNRFGQRPCLLIAPANAPFKNLARLHHNVCFSTGDGSSKETRNSTQLFNEEHNFVEAMKDVAPVENVINNDIDQRGLSNEESSIAKKIQEFDNLSDLNLKADYESAYPLLIYGGGSVIILFIASAIVAAVDSIPLFPKLMEIVGVSYSIWFSYRYLLFKKSRNELGSKLQELNQQIFGVEE